MPSQDSTRRNSPAIAACLAAGATAATCEVIRALASGETLAARYVALCVALVVAASALVGTLAALARLSAALALVAWLAAAGALVHGALGAAAFAFTALALGWLVRRSPPPALVWAVAAGALFEIAWAHAGVLSGVIAAGKLTHDQAAIARHLFAFAIPGLALAWIAGRPRLRSAPLLSACAVWIMAALVSALGPAERSARAPREAQAPPSATTDGDSVLLVVVDTLRADHTSLYGYARRTTPELERLLAERPGAVRYAQAYANASWTAPAHASLLTGQLPSAHGADYAGRKHDATMSVALYPGVTTLPELASANGWATLAVFANPWLGTTRGLERGFASYELVEPDAALEPLAESLRELAFPALRASDVKPYASAEAVLPKLLARLDELDGARFLALVNLMDTHGPHLPLPGYAGAFGPWSIFDESPQVMLRNGPELNRRLMDRYDEQILHLDFALGRLFEELERRGALERTWVFVLADHGEAFGEHGVTDHGTAAYDELVRIPLLVFPPRGGELAPDTGPVSQVDVAATVAAIAGVSSSGPGRDLRIAASDGFAQVQHSSAPFRVARHGALAGRDARAVVRGSWKLLEIDGTLQLFDLEHDPGETRDLSAERADVVELLAPQLPERLLHSAPVDRELAAPSSADAERLKQLGY